MKLGPTLPWFYCRSSDKTIRSFHASLLHLENENITSHFSPLEARVKMNLTETAKAMLLRQAGQKGKTRLKKSWRTGMSQIWGSGWWFEQTDTTISDRCWVWGSADWGCCGWSPHLCHGWGHAAPHWGHHVFPPSAKYSRYFWQLRVQEWLLQHIEPCQESVA